MRSAVFDRSPRGLVVVGGDDATSFLQSLISQDLDGIEDGQSRSSLLLTPQGKLDVVFRVTRVGDAWWLDTDAEYSPRLAESLTRFRIRVKAEIDDRTALTGMLSILGRREHRDDAVRYVQTQWGDVEGTDILGDREAIDRVRGNFEAGGHPVSGADAFEPFRIEHGVPRLGVDIDEKTIPQEAFLDRDAVSFTKGCFLGQELVARIDSRGHVNRYLRRLEVEGSAVPPTGATIVVDEKDVGSVTSAAAIPDDGRVVALGMIRREVEPSAKVTIRIDTFEVAATVQDS